MIDHSHLELLEGQIDFDIINKVLAERDLWNERKSATVQKEALEYKTEFKHEIKCQDGVVEFHPPKNITAQARADVKRMVDLLRDWKKGPFKVDETFIDAEWRSDLKWDRLKQSLPDLEGKDILDIGCNNGYFMFRMLESNPRYVLGIDPYHLVWAQFQFLKNISAPMPMYHELLGIEHMSSFKDCFDVIFSMGILYHHRHPLEQLLSIRDALKPGGELIIETIGIPGEENVSLTPADRYANMRNVWFVPTLKCLITWLERTKFVDIEVISTKWDKTEEQRHTNWSESPSYRSFLDPNDETKTLEGYPAPERFLLKAKRRN